MHSEQEEQEIQFPQWMRGVLLVAAIYNLAWGLLISLFPNAFYQWVANNTQAAPGIIWYQGIGVALFAISYFIAALYPIKYWYLIYLGVISKLVGAIWFYFAIMQQQVNKKSLFHVFMNDLVWVIPLGLIAYTAYNVHKTRSQ